MPKELPSDMLNDSLKEVVYKRKNNDTFKTLVKDCHFNRREVEALALIHYKIVQHLGPLHRLTFRDVLHSGLDFTENYLVDRIFGDFDKKNDLIIPMDSWVRGFSEVLRGTLDERIKYAYRVRGTVHYMIVSRFLQDQINGLCWIRLCTFMSSRGNINATNKLREKRLMQKIVREDHATWLYKLQIYDLMRTNKIRKGEIFPMMRACIVKPQADEDPDESVKDLIDLLLKKIDVDRDGQVSDEEYSSNVKERNLLFLECMGLVFPSREASHAFLTTFTDQTKKF